MARHLAKRRLDFKLIEAQDTLGGRIQSTAQGLDLGPTWFWPHQHGVQALLTELNMAAFPQYTQGDLMYQANPNGPTQREPYQQDMQSNRIAGGMGALIKALHNGHAETKRGPQRAPVATRRLQPFSLATLLSST